MSWASRRNTRRLRRAEVLRVRAETRRNTVHWRRLIFALGLAAVTALAGHFVLRFWGSMRDQVLLPNRVFALRQVDVNPDLAWLTRDQIIRWAGVRPGENLLSIDLDRIKRDLELIPQVEEAAVERVIPGTLRIQVRERQPLARVRGVDSRDGRLVPAMYFLDGHAKVMPPLAAGRPDLHTAFQSLPVLTGLGSGSLRVGDDLPGPTVRAALDLVRLFPHAAIARQVGLSTVSVAETSVLQVRTRDGAEVTLGLRGLEAQLHRWHLVHDAGTRLGRAIQWLDLSMTNNCPVLWQPAPAGPDSPQTPPAVETKPTGDHHV